MEKDLSLIWNFNINSMAFLYSALSEEDLVSAMQKDDVQAFEEIYRRNWKKLYSEAYRRLEDAGACEELLQDVFTDLWLKRHTNQVQQLYPYLYAAVRYKVYARYHQLKKLPRFCEPLDHMAQTAKEVEGHIMAKQLLAFIELWLKEQPEKRKAIFRLRFFEDLSTAEIGKSLDISQNTVQNQLNTAFKSLRISLARFIGLFFY